MPRQPSPMFFSQLYNNIVTDVSTQPRPSSPVLTTTVAPSNPSWKTIERKRWILTPFVRRENATVDPDSPRMMAIRRGLADILDMDNTWGAMELECPTTYVPGMPFFPYYVVKKLPIKTKRLHEWYEEAYKFNVLSMTAVTNHSVFLDGGSTVVVEFKDLHAMFRHEEHHDYLLMQQDMADNAKLDVAYLNPIKISKPFKSTENQRHTKKYLRLR
uniref:Uncharacterized protein n=1 Tax=Leersia perrieri TaxID=77586 RepID=A0A0D9XRR4_9ORYZ